MKTKAKPAGSSIAKLANEPSMLFHRIALEAFCHATEDVKKVKQAMANLVPFEVPDSAFESERMEGSFGNEIISLTLEFSKQGEINCIVKSLVESLPKQEMKSIDLKQHINEALAFWIRFDKQSAYNGEVKLDGHDTVQLRGKIAAFPATRQRAVQVMKGLWS